MTIPKLAFAALAILALAPTSAFARHHHYAHSRSGACDGIHRCICGSTQAAHFGLPRMYNGHNLWQAAEWPRAFPHTAPHVGAVMYRHGGGPTGHVSRVVAYSGGCAVTVTDDAGTHEDNACSRGATFVDVTLDANGNRASVTHSARRHHHERYAVAEPPAAPDVAIGVH